MTAINGQPTSAAAWHQLLAALPPGAQITVAYKRSKSADPMSAVPRGDPAGVAD